MAINLIGAGFGRTGTLLLKIAVERLGLAPCYHMSEVFQHPEHVAVWGAALDANRVERDALFLGYRPTIDWPGCHFWRELAHSIVTQLINVQTFGGRFDDRDHAIGVFERHNEAVQRGIPRERLLVYGPRMAGHRSAASWVAPPPDEPFPRVSSKDECRARAGLR